MATILIIEDEAPIRANLVRFLSLEGYRVVQAENGRIGCELARCEAPDLIFCDVMMPEMDGFAVIRDLRADPATAGIPFVFLTASAEKDDIRLGVELGADDYVTKPFNIADLLALVARRLGEQDRNSVTTPKEPT
jgi:DNA-binding response OmpR family regulator